MERSTTPEPLSYDPLSNESVNIDPSLSQVDQNIWTTAENFFVFRDSLSRLAKRISEQQAIALSNNLPSPIISFDKDDDDTLDFVTAAANLRARIFDIEPKSKFDTKQMAGNIIPAIATTNAMIAGLCVLQAFKVLKGDFARTKMIYLDRGNMSATAYDPPNPDCVVCSMAMARLRIDPDRATLRELVQDILKTSLAYSDEISILSEVGLIYDPDLEDNLDKKLVELGVKDGSFIVAKDDDDDETPRVDLQLAIEVRDEEGDSTGPAVQLVLKEGETLAVPRRPRRKAAGLAENGVNGMDGEKMAENGGGPSTSTTTTGKRKRDADEADLDITEGTPVKKLQLSKGGEGNEAVVVNVDEGDGAILIE